MIQMNTIQSWAMIALVFALVGALLWLSAEISGWHKERAERLEKATQLTNARAHGTSRMAGASTTGRRLFLVPALPSDLHTQRRTVNGPDLYDWEITGI